MGLFRRRDPSTSDPAATDPADAQRDAEVAALRTEVTELRRELAMRVDTEASGLRTELEATRAALSSQVDAQSASLRDELTTVRERVDPVAAGLADLTGRLDAIDERFSRPLTDPPPPPPATPPAADRGAIDSLGSQLTRLEERITAVDRRVTAVSTELANQLAEIDADLDALTRIREEAETEATASDVNAPVDDAQIGGPDPAAGPVVDTEMLDELFDELRDAQQRLANEQARYQIAFREDLARLAEDLRRRANR